MYTALKWCGRLDVVPLALTCLSQCSLCMVLKSLQNTKKYFNEFKVFNEFCEIYHFEHVQFLTSMLILFSNLFPYLYPTNIFISEPRTVSDDINTRVTMLGYFTIPK